MLTYLLGPLVGLPPGPLAFGLGVIECLAYLIAIKPLTKPMFFGR